MTLVETRVTSQFPAVTRAVIDYLKETQPRGRTFAEICWHVRKHSKYAAMSLKELECIVGTLKVYGALDLHTDIYSLSPHASGRVEEVLSLFIRAASAECRSDILEVNEPATSPTYHQAVLEALSERYGVSDVVGTILRAKAITPVYKEPT